MFEIISREASLAAGRADYFTGRPCKHGHVDIRNTLRRQCRSCETMNSTRWARAHLGIRAAQRAKKRAAHQTPPWADLTEIRRIYEECPEGFHVDHVVPLAGELVSGLHVPRNLQYLPARDNARKGASFDPEENHHL